MKARLVLATGFLSSLLCSPAMAENWVQVYPTPPDYTLFYDSTTVDHQGNVAAVLSLTNFVAPQTDPNVLGGSVSFSSRTDVMVFDCSTREVSAIGDFMFHSSQWAGGSVVFQTDAYDQTRRPVHPNTANETMYQAACR